MSYRFYHCGVSLLLLLVGCSQTGSLRSVQDTDWRYYNGSHTSTRYVELDQIDKSNVSQLRVAWEYEIPRDERNADIKCNPLIIDGVLYANTAVNLVALDADTGKQKWYLDWTKHDSSRRQSSSRGLLYWEKGENKRLFVAHRKYYYAVNAETGKLVSSFGENGRIPFIKGLRADSSMFVILTTPGVIFEDLIITGSFVSEQLPAAPGDIRAFSAIDGELKWIFHTIPHPGEFGYDTWPEGTHLQQGGANNWGGMSLDQERGIVYIPTGSATYDFYGANRHGKNLFANTLLALDARTGKRIWHYQIVHHDLWDRDLPCAPNLLTVEHEGQKVDAVAQGTKQGYIFLFNRETGEPLFEIDEVPVPQSTMPGEQSWPTQPIPRKPPAIVRQEFTKEDVANWSTEIADSVRGILAKFKTHLFAPPDTIGIVLQPGVAGGMNWSGTSIHEPSATLIATSEELPNVIRLVNRHEEFRSMKLEGADLYRAYCGSCHGESFQGGHYIPALTDLEKRYNRDQIAEVIEKGRGNMPAFSNIEEGQRQAIAAYILNEEFDNDKLKRLPDSIRQSMSLKYTIEGFEEIELPDDLLPIKPPWGTITAVDLNLGEIKWQVPLGNDDEIEVEGWTGPTGQSNTGGSVITETGLIFVAATGDNKIRAFDVENGDEVWSYRLPGEGVATPSIYAVGNRQYIVIAATGSWDGDYVGKYVAFSL